MTTLTGGQSLASRCTWLRPLGKQVFLPRLQQVLHERDLLQHGTMTLQRLQGPYANCWTLLIAQDNAQDAYPVKEDPFIALKRGPPVDTLWRWTAGGLPQARQSPSAGRPAQKSRSILHLCVRDRINQ